MPQDEERITESNSNINTITELPGRPFRITMELPMFLTLLGLSLSGTAISNIILYRTCVQSLHHTEMECQPFLAPVKTNQTKQLEEEVQKYATFVTTVKIVIESVVPAVLSLFLGVWSDIHGRKPLVVWPLLGMSLTSMMAVVYSMLDNLGPWWYILTIIPFSLSGGYTAFFTGAFCYVSDVTTTEKRSLRMALLEASVSAGSVVGSLLSSYLLRTVGNVYLLLIVTALYVIAYAFTNIYLTESLTGALKGGLSTVLDLLLVKEMIRECFKERPNRGRAQILLLTVANSLSIFILYGLSSLEYLYAREKLHWALKEYTMYSALNTLISFVGAFLGIALLQKVLRVSDLALASVAFLSNVGEYIVKMLAVTTWHMYIAATVAMFKVLSAPLIRSFLTKTLPVEDIAKVFALMAAIEGICPIFSPPIYNSLYASTISSFPGAVYLLSSGVAGTCFVFLGIVQFYRWNASSETYHSLPAEEES